MIFGVRLYTMRTANGMQECTRGGFKEVWQMKAESRMKAMDNWRSEMLQERIARLHEAGTVYNASLNQIRTIHMEKDLQVIRRKRIIGCTTTAAAKYVQAL